jgi:hypothetical protein
MSKRRTGSVIAYGACVVLGLIGTSLCCFFGFGGISSPTLYSLAFIVPAAAMIILIAFGYRGLRERRKLGNEIWWQLLIIGLIALSSLAFMALFTALSITLLSEGSRTF